MLLPNNSQILHLEAAPKKVCGDDLGLLTLQDDRPEGETEGEQAFWDGRLSPLSL